MGKRFNKIISAILAMTLFMGISGIDVSYVTAANIGETKVENTDTSLICSNTTDQNMSSGLCATEKASIRRSRVAYYMAAHTKEGESYGNGAVRKIILKKKKIITYGSFAKSPNNSLTNAVYCKNKKRTFKLAKNVKFYTQGGMAGKRRTSRTNIKALFKTANGLEFILKVKNGKVAEVMFSS